jgi:hypothetical protein
VRIFYDRPQPPTGPGGPAADAETPADYQI